MGSSRPDHVLATWTEQRGRQHVRERGGGRCEIGLPGVCQGRATSVHHRRHRGQGGSWHPANLLDACGDGTRGCHGWCESQRDLAHELGLELRAGDPAERPVALHHGVYGAGWWVLNDEGNLEWLQPLSTT